MPLLQASPKLVKQYDKEVTAWLAGIAGEHITLPELYHELRTGGCELRFTFTDDSSRLIGVVVTSVRDDTLVFIGAAGNVLNEWDTLHAQFVELARSKGCTRIEFRGRRGFLRTFKQYGMVEDFVVMHMDI